VDEAKIDEVGRPEPPQEAGEIATLLGFLDFQRATLEWKCRGLSDDQLRVALPPTSMTLGGLLKHLAYVEVYWFAQMVAGQSPTEPWASQDWEADPDWEWHSAADDPGDELRALWAGQVERSRSITASQLAQADAEVAALGQAHSASDGQGRFSLRWVLVHMIEESDLRQ
jgi:uncharacterized protein DUF664